MALGGVLTGCAGVADEHLTMTRVLPSKGSALAPPADYALSWSDEFDEAVGMPSSARWGYDTARNKAGWYNGESQYYSKKRRENARVEGGRLIIEARAEDLSSLRLRDWGGQRYSSARLTTLGKAAWHHGFFEIRARMPCARGTWPALWLHPERQDGRWQGGEIDIAEAVGHEPGKVHHSIQTTTRNFRKGNHLTGTTRTSTCDAFHDYQLHWTREWVAIGVDGRVRFVAPADAFDRAMVLMVNLAVGGTWGGARGIDDDALPARLEIEWVRVWQKRTSA